jgi:thiol-disulfide isomerase/thioredoxin
MQSFDHFPVTHQFTLMDGSRLRLQSERIENSRFVGKSAILGDCIVSIGNVREMRRGPATPAHELEKSGISAFSDWQLTLTPDPDIPTGENTQVSPLIGKPAPPIKLSQLGKESDFELSKHKGRVVVLDFWATWCGPCIKAIPDVQKVVGAFPQGSVVFQAVNQAETVPIITGFLEARKWQDLPVSLDFDLMVSNAYLVDGIPHTVVIGRDGKVAWTHSGYSEDLKMQLFDAVAAELQK